MSRDGAKTRESCFATLRLCEKSLEQNSDIHPMGLTNIISAIQSRQRIKSFLFTVFFALSFHAVTGRDRIDRHAVVTRHNITTTLFDTRSPAQVGNGEFAFGVDITGLQTFTPFYTSSQWAWHSIPLPEGVDLGSYRPQMVETHGRPVAYEIPDPDHPEITQWLAGNPHRFHLGQIGFVLLKSDGERAGVNDLANIRQHTDLWTGVVSSYFELEGVPVAVRTYCHGEKDAIGVEVRSPLIGKGQLQVSYSFPYPEAAEFARFVYDKPGAHQTVVQQQGKGNARLERTMDDASYHVLLNWTGKAEFAQDSSHFFRLVPKGGNTLEFATHFSEQPVAGMPTVSARECLRSSVTAWKQFWESGAAIDLSESTDPRWSEMERRIILSQYVMRVNEAGSLPPQESGLVNNGWHGRFHFEMIWWHGVHYALWNRWPLIDRALHVYQDFLPTSKQRAEGQGYRGARWPKCTADFDREWPHIIHATLIWQQPHPIYFAELDYRLHPTKETLDKWKDVVMNSADFMADFAFYQKENDRYVLGPPLYIVSENTDWKTTSNPAFELSYWRFGLRTAQQWRERLSLAREAKWDDVLQKLSPLPVENEIYVTHEGIADMWTKYNFEHPALIGTLGMLPGDGVDTTILKSTLEKVLETWNLERTWGWDFPMLAMAAARTGNMEKAVDLLLYPTEAFGFDDHGLSTGGPYPYFPANGGLLTAVAMMAGGWDGSLGDAPGFPKNGKWTVKQEGFNKLL